MLELTSSYRAHPTD